MRGAQPELPCAHGAPADVGEEHRHQHERAVLHDGVEDLQPPRDEEAVMLTPNSAAGMSTTSPPTAASSSPPKSAAGAVHHGQFVGSLGPGGPGGSLSSGAR